MLCMFTKKIKIVAWKCVSYSCFKFFCLFAFLALKKVKIFESVFSEGYIKIKLCIFMKNFKLEKWLSYCNWIIAIWCDSSSSSSRNVNNLGLVVLRRTGQAGPITQFWHIINIILNQTIVPSKGHPLKMQWPSLSSAGKEPNLILKNQVSYISSFLLQQLLNHPIIKPPI